MASEPETVHTSDPSNQTPVPYDPSKVFGELVDGHQRYRKGPMLHPHTGFDDMVKLALKQTPKICILACADSRVPPEVIFDQGLGDMFVVRVAGNFADDDNQASLEYAIQHFDPPPAIIVVLGHERCGAVQAAAITFDQGSVLPEHVEKFKHHPEPSQKLKDLVKRLESAIVNTKKPQPTTETEYALRLDDAVRRNVMDNVAALQANNVIKGFIEKTRTFVIGARYDLDTGEIEWLTAKPSGPTAGAH